MSNSIDEFLRKIWITRKCRIKASERLYRIDIFSQFFAIYYSICIVCMSIWNLVYPDMDFSLKLLIASVALTIIQVFITSRRFNERYINFKSNYIALDRIYNELQANKEITKNEDAIERIKKKYFDLLDSIENHNEHDYLSVIVSMEGEINSWQRLRLYGLRIGKASIFVAIMIFPFLLKLVSLK